MMLNQTDFHPANFGRLWWNQAEAKLVVLDGQHRAMALLAIERTVSGSWQSTSGARFRSFYENQVRQALREHQDIDLSKIEVPVTVCWFPEHNGAKGEPHMAARKLFVDVNKEAKPPSESRIILLSDSELVNVLTRSMLGLLRDRSNEDLLPLYAVEYDNPEVNSSRPARWSVMTNIHLLKMAVDRCVFGPRKFLQDVTQMASRGRPNRADRDEFMREQLNVLELFESQFEDGGFSYHREAISDTNFPLGRSDVLCDQFTRTWGMAILTLLSKTAPYAAHAAALNRLNTEWHVDDTYLALAHDALFSGVGVYWTLKDSYDHYLDKGRKGQLKDTSDVINAWKALETKEKTFELFRAEAYMGSTAKDRTGRCKDAYLVFNTQACQLGLILTLGTLWELRKQDGAASFDDLPDFAESMMQALNVFFAKEHGKSRDRRLAFNKRNIPNPINQIGNMDSTQAAYFRFFWMQALAVPEPWSHLQKWFPSSKRFDEALSRARKHYLAFCAEQKLKALKAASAPGTNEADLRKDAEKRAREELKKALKDWFEVDAESYERWLQQPEKLPPIQEHEPEGDSQGLGDETSDTDPSESRVTDIAELLENEDEEK
ncbi:hypothetical protein Mame01_53580 [Microbispora amethystogenes]|nr:hypothetical protein Mame01_53580 [Microbispora amethystogenes]